MSPHLVQKGWAVTLLAIQPACSLFGPESCDLSIGNLLRITVTDFQTKQVIGGPFALTVISETSGDSLVMAFPADAVQPFTVRSFGSGGDYTVDLQKGRVPKVAPQ